MSPDRVPTFERTQKTLKNESCQNSSRGKVASFEQVPVFELCALAGRANPFHALSKTKNRRQCLRTVFQAPNGPERLPRSILGRFYHVEGLLASDKFPSSSFAPWLAEQIHSTPPQRRRTDGNVSGPCCNRQRVPKDSQDRILTESITPKCRQLRISSRL